MKRTNHTRWTRRCKQRNHAEAVRLRAGGIPKGEKSQAEYMEATLANQRMRVLRRQDRP